MAATERAGGARWALLVRNDGGRLVHGKVGMLPRSTKKTWQNIPLILPLNNRIFLKIFKLLFTLRTDAGETANFWYLAGFTLAKSSLSTAPKGLRSDQEWPPLQQGAMSRRAARVRFKSPAQTSSCTDWTAAPRGCYTRSGTRRRLVYAAYPRGRPEKLMTGCRSGGSSSVKFPAAKTPPLAMLLLGGPPLQPPARGGWRRSRSPRNTLS